MSTTLINMSESKNSYTQALRLGECLRQEPIALQGSAIMFTATIPIPFLRATKMLLGILSMRHVQLLPAYFSRRIRTTPRI
jgi:hypothetical protein